MLSLVTTVLNDKSGLWPFEDRIAKQTLMPDEIIVVDGGSTDGTWEVLRTCASSSPHFKISQEKGCNVARGRNLAIAQATGDIIVSTDIGCEWDPEWLQELVQPFFDDPSIEVVIGSWAVRSQDLHTAWAKTELALRGSMQLNATPDSLGISRSIAYRKSVWEKAGGYPEDLTLAADDVVFDMQLKQMGFKTAAAPVIRCYWMRHERLKQYAREERRNFLGAGEAAIWRKHFVLVFGRLLLEAGGLVLGLLLLFVGLIPAAGFCLAIASLSLVHRLWRLRPAAQRLRQMDVDLPWLRLILFEYVTKAYGMWGYLRGYVQGFFTCQDCRKRLQVTY
jgi:glycosyltransferase involved in cell wall biosynthesis